MKYSNTSARPALKQFVNTVLDRHGFLTAG